jgi:hypothetical protein
MSTNAAALPSDTASPGWREKLRPPFRPMRWFRRRMLRKPASTLALSVGTLLSGVIVMNALALQTERHPAPLFTSLIEERSVAPAPAVVPPPVARPESQERKREAARDPRAPSSSRDETTRSVPVSKDQLLAVIKNGAPEASVDPAARILQVQRALNKAGFGPLKEDGVMGPGTKQALERFEAARKLPVKGEAQGRTLRELAKHSGVGID